MIQCPVESSLECTYVCFSSGLKCTLGIKRYEVLSFSTQTQHTIAQSRKLLYSFKFVLNECNISHSDACSRNELICYYLNMMEKNSKNTLGSFT